MQGHAAERDRASRWSPQVRRDGGAPRHRFLTCSPGPVRRSDRRGSVQQPPRGRCGCRGTRAGGLGRDWTGRGGAGSLTTPSNCPAPRRCPAPPAPHPPARKRPERGRRGGAGGGRGIGQWQCRLCTKRPMKASHQEGAGSGAEPNSSGDSSGIVKWAGCGVGGGGGREPKKGEEGDPESKTERPGGEGAGRKRLREPKRKTDQLWPWASPFLPRGLTLPTWVKQLGPKRVS